jgi:hypothetical protein
VWCYGAEPIISEVVWTSHGLSSFRCIDDFPGIVFPGTCDWKDSKQRRPRG